MSEPIDLQTYRNTASQRLSTILAQSPLAVFADDIERAIYAEFQEQALINNFPETDTHFSKLYVSKARQIIDNLDPKSYIGNAQLIGRFSEAALENTDFNRLIRFTPQELYPDHWADLLEAKKRRDEIHYSSTSEAMTDAYQCKKCQSRKITYWELQIRSADEGFTTFYECLDCGGKWRKN